MISQKSLNFGKWGDTVHGSPTRGIDALGSNNADQSVVDQSMADYSTEHETTHELSTDENLEYVEEEENEYRNSLILDEAEEMGEEEEDSMDEEERRYIEENTIPETGIELGEEDSDIEEVDDEEYDDSFIASDSEDEYDEDEEDEEIGTKKKGFKRIVLNSDSSDVSEQSEQKEEESEAVQVEDTPIPERLNKASKRQSLSVAGATKKERTSMNKSLSAVGEGEASIEAFRAIAAEAATDDNNESTAASGSPLKVSDMAIGERLEKSKSRKSVSAVAVAKEEAVGLNRSMSALNGNAATPAKPFVNGSATGSAAKSSRKSLANDETLETEVLSNVSGVFIVDQNTNDPTIDEPQNTNASFVEETIDAAAETKALAKSSRKSWNAGFAEESINTKPIVDGDRRKSQGEIVEFKEEDQSVPLKTTPSRRSVSNSFVETANEEAENVLNASTLSKSRKSIGDAQQNGSIVEPEVAAVNGKSPTTNDISNSAESSETAVGTDEQVADKTVSKKKSTMTNILLDQNKNKTGMSLLSASLIFKNSNHIHTHTLYMYTVMLIRAWAPARDASMCLSTFMTAYIVGVSNVNFDVFLVHFHAHFHYLYFVLYMLTCA